MNIRQFIKTKRKELGLTQYQLANLLGVKRAAVDGWESKNKYIGPKLEKVISKYLPEWTKDPLWETFREPKKERKRCCVKHCFKYAVTKNMCDKHYREFKKYGKIREQCEKRAQNGEGHLDNSGYIRVPNPRGGQTFQHRLVMEEFLNRPLLPSENVHHINGVRNDNRLENLELWSKSQPCGQRVEQKLKWAKEFLEIYGYTVVKESH